MRFDKGGNKWQCAVRRKMIDYQISRSLASRKELGKQKKNYDYNESSTVNWRVVVFFSEFFCLHRSGQISLGGPALSFGHVKCAGLDASLPLSLVFLRTSWVLLLLLLLLLMFVDEACQ